MLGCEGENQERREFTKDDVKILKCLLNLIRIGISERSRGKPKILA